MEWTLNRDMNLSKILGDIHCAIALSKDPVNRQRCKHIDIKYHFIRDALHKKKIEIIHCPTTDIVGYHLPFRHNQLGPLPYMAVALIPRSPVQISLRSVYESDQKSRSY